MLTAAKTEICSIEGCNRVVHGKGLCFKHYQNELYASKTNKCNVDWCERVEHLKGLCRHHYVKEREAAITDKCVVNGCDKIVLHGKLCSEHYHKSQYAKNPERRREISQSFRKNNPDKVKKSYRKWRTEHLEEDRARSRANSLRYYAENPDKVHERAREQKHKRRAIKMQLPGKFTADDWRALVARSPRCHWCKRPWKEVGSPTHDHVIPLSKGGANSPENSVCACRSCNTKKQATRFDPISGQGILL